MKIHCQKILSLLLAISLLLTLSPVTPVTAEETATAANETTLSTTEEIIETDAPAAAPAMDLTADCAILNYVDEEVFEAGNHVLRLHNEETLSSYVFLNADGTWSHKRGNTNVTDKDASCNVIQDPQYAD